MKNGMKSSLEDTGEGFELPRVTEQKLGIEAEGNLGIEEKGRLGISFLMKARPVLGLPIGIPAKNLC